MSYHRSCCCKVCNGGLGVELSIIDLDANRCTPCVQEGALAVAWDVSSLAINGTYAISPAGSPSSNYVFPRTITGTGYAHAKEYVLDAGVCTTLLEESDSSALTLLVVVDCTDVDALGSPRIKTVSVQVPFPGGFPAFGTAPINAFSYSSIAHGGTYYVGDGQSIPNSLVACAGGNTVTINGTVKVHRA